MSEEVQTGGVMRFRYGKNDERKLSDSQKKEIDEAYARANERKAKEKRNKMIFWIVGGLIALILLGILIWSFVK